MISPIEWWLDYCKVEQKIQYEKPAILSTSEVSDIKSSANLDKLKADIIAEIPSINKDGFTLRTSDCATDLIEQLFNHYVDDSTLVLTTNYEHPVVCECLDKCKNVKKIDITKPVDALEVYQECQKYKSIFCYMIGVTNNFVNETSYATLHIVRHVLNQLSKPSVFVLDDCQGFLIRTRDWSMFDYIVTTAHAFLPMDLGVTFCKSPFAGFGNLDVPESYLHVITQIKQKLPRIFLFNSCMQEFFADTTQLEFIRPCSPIHAVIKVRMPNVVEKLKSIGINSFNYYKTDDKTDDRTDEYTSIESMDGLVEQSIRFRAFKYIFNSTGFVDQLKNLKYLVQENANN